MHAITRERIASFIFSLGLAVLLLGLLSRRLFLWERNWLIILSSVPTTLIVSSLLFIAAILAVKGKISYLRVDYTAFVLGLVLLFFSDWFVRSYNLFQGPIIRGELILFSLVAFLLPYRGILATIQFYPMFTIALLVTSFLIMSNGRLLFSDDHAVFLYRLQLLKDNFPIIPFFNPMWNAGVDARDFFATGCLNIFFLNSAWIYLFELGSAYNFIVAFTVLCLPGVTTYITCKLMQSPAPVPAIAAVLAVCSGLTWYRWAFKYGTMGFITSCALIPLVFVLSAKILSKEQSITKFQAIFFVLVASLMLLWSPTGIVFLPIIAVGLFSIRRVWFKKFVPSIAFSLVLINLPWIMLFASVSNIFQFFQGKHPSIYASRTEQAREPRQAKPRELSPWVEDLGPIIAPNNEPASFDFKRSFTVLRQHAVSANPVILLLTLPGIFLLPRMCRYLFIAAAIWLALLGTLLVPIKPHMEFDRMIVVLFFISSIPTAYALHSILQSIKGSCSLLQRGVAAIALGFFLTTPFAAASFLHNRSFVKYDFAKPIVQELSHALTEFAGEGRTVFSGFVLHELSGGHLAPLIHFSKRPLLASSFVHNVWQPKDIIPDTYLMREDFDTAIEEYFSLYNIGNIITHDHRWHRYFSDRDAQYEMVWQREKFTLFKRKGFVNSYFYEGNGEVLSQSTSSITVRVESESAVLKFNYFPFLTSDECTVSPYVINEDITLVRLEHCAAGREVSIRAISGFKRIWL